jgi:hypothetical protein
MIAVRRGDFVRLLAAHAPVLEQVFEVAVADGHALADRLVERGLGERRFIRLVVPVAAVAIHVDDHVAAVLLAEFEREPDALRHGLRILAVDVEDWDLEHFENVRRVSRRASFLGTGRKSNLVVHDHMKGSAHGIAGKLAHVERLLHHSLARNGGVAMNQDGQVALAAGVVHPFLLRARAPDGHGVDELEVARIEAERQMNRVARAGFPIVAEPEMVFHIAAAGVAFVIGVGKLAENLPRRLAQDVREDVKAAPVRHAEDDFTDALFAGLLDGQVEQGNQAFGAFERKAFGANEFLPHKLFEDGRVGETGQDPELFLARKRQPVLRAFHARLEPATDMHVIDVHVLDADGTAIGIAQALDDLRERGFVAQLHGFGGETLLHVGRGETIKGGIQLGRSRALAVERIDPGHHVATQSVGADQLVDAVLETRDAMAG